MTTTQQYLAEITGLNGRFSKWLDKDMEIATDYDAARKKAETGYEDARKQLERERHDMDANHANEQNRIHETYSAKRRDRDRRREDTLSSIAATEKQTKESAEADVKQTRENVEADAAMLKNIEDRAKLETGSSKSETSGGSRPDFKALIALLEKTRKPASAGFVVLAVLSLGLAVLVVMKDAQMIPAGIFAALAALCVIGFVVKAVKRSVARHALRNGIASARAYLANVLEEGNAYLATAVEESNAAAERERAAADKVWNAEKADAERDEAAETQRFEQRKAHEIAAFEEKRNARMRQIEEEKETAERQIKEQRANGIAELDKEFAAALNDARQTDADLTAVFETLGASRFWSGDISPAQAYPGEIMLGVLKAQVPSLPVSKTRGAWLSAEEFRREVWGVSLF